MYLLDLMGIEYRRSRWALYGSLLCGAAIYAFVLIDTLSQHAVSGWLACVVFLVQIIALVLKHKCSTHYRRAEEIRRLAVFKDGLEIEPSEIVKAQILARCGTAKPPEKIHVGRYFASEETPGVVRLLDDVEESAYYTYNVASFAGKAGIVAVIVGVAVSVGALIAIMKSAVSPSALQNIAEAFVVTLGFVVAGDFLMLSLAYWQLSEDACRAMKDAAARLESGNRDRDSAIVLFGEYNCSLSSAPPLPTFIHVHLHPRLSAGWSNRRTKIPVE